MLTDILLAVNSLGVMGLGWVVLRRRPAPPPPPPAPIVSTMQIPQADWVWQVERRGDGGWEHWAWVRHDTQAWREAFATPGARLRRGTEVIEGVQ